MNAIVETISASIFLLSILFIICGLDDAFIDAVAWLFRLGPKKISAAEWIAIKTKAEKPIAIVVPAWDESGVIGRMLKGNLARVHYQKMHFFVGVYPNDEETIREVEEIAARDPRIHAIVNDRNGPTSKGQILNYVVREIFRKEPEIGLQFAGILLHDSEDVIHPDSLALLSHEMECADFIQIPIFSLPLSMTELTGGTYIDEFAEVHTKDLLVRQKLGAPIPSAGVGTLCSRQLILALLEAQGGDFLAEGSVTEDYELGWRSHRLGFKTSFCCKYLGRNQYSSGLNIIGTREFFPRSAMQSIRQKSRWTRGIVYQGWARLGWARTLTDNYFLWRDRKGVIANPATALAYALAILYSVIALGPEHASLSLTRATLDWNNSQGAPIDIEHILLGLLAANTLLTMNRLFQRIWCVQRIYGWKTTLLLPLRWPLGVIINASAAGRAARQQIESALSGREIGWGKTKHELPSMFGEATP